MEKLVFKSEEDRQAAFDKIDDHPPLGVNIDEWTQEHDEKTQKVVEAEINPEAPDKPPTEDPPPDTSSEPPPESPPASPPAPSSEEPPTPSAEETLRAELEAERRRNADLMAETQRMNEITEKTKTLEQQIEDLKKQNEEIAKATPSQPSKIDIEMSNISQEIEKLEDELNKLDETDLETKQKKTQEILTKSIRYNRMMEKKNTDIIKERAEADKRRDEERKKEEEARKRQRAEEDKQQKETERRNAIAEEMEAFRKKKSELAGSQGYRDMEREVGNWAFQLAALDFGKPANAILRSEAEISLKRYLAKTPTLMDSVQRNALKEPTNLKQFLLLSEIEMARTGLEINSQGKMVKRVDSLGNQVILPDFDTAYDYVRKTNGTLAEEAAKKEAETAKKVVKTMEQRTDPSELDVAHVKTQGTDMSLEEATKIMNEMDERVLVEEARRAVQAGQPLPQKVQFYNRAMERIGAFPITGQE